jgi:LuxR family maltose regulon positive regulatory protein
MIFLADHLPPHMHLVIISRADPPLPLARLRARDHMIEVRAADLRFTPEEAAIFLNQTMGLSLSAEQVAALEARTEGWITGLQLAALSMQGQHDVASFIAAFTGSHRFVLDYLSDEVVRQQSEAVQQFLLRTCILERLCGPLCDAVMGIGDQGSSIRNAQPIPDPRSLIPDSYSQFTLEQLERANLFLVPLDNDRQWYRYHHLFADVLRKRLEQHQPDLVPQLHRRASVWYEQASLTTQAVQHALAAHAFSRAAALVEQVAPTMLQYSGLAQLLTWLGALPVDEVRARPLLGLYYTWGLFLSGQVRQAANRLEAIEAMLTTDSAKQAPEVYGHIAAMRAYLVRDTGDFAATIAFSRQALANLPEHDSRLWAGVAVNLALAHYLQGEFDLAEPLLSEIIATGQMAQRIANTLSAMYIKTQLLRAQGALHQARQLCRDGLEVVIRGGWHNYPEVGHLYLVLGDLARERNELSAAAEHLKKGIELGQEGHPHILIIGHVWLARLLQAEGDVTGSQEAIRVALRLVQQHQVSPFWPLPSAACYQARLWIVQGNLAAASHWGQASRLNQANAPGAYMYEIEYVTLARLLIAQGSLEGAEAMLLRLHHSADSAQRKGSLIEICILQAITYAAQQRAEAAFSALTQALGLAEPEGYVRIFVDEGAPVARLLQTAQARGIAPKYVETLLASFPEAQSIERTTQNNRTLALGATPERSNALVEPLTNRELQVLHLMAAGASNQTIADQLVITLHTAKKHVGIILGKLGVANRTEAVARARELSIL